MRNCIKTVLALTSFVVTMQMTATESYAAGASTSCTAPKLTDAQCAKVRADLNAYIAFVTKYFGSGPVVQSLIKLAKADVDKLCPLSGNNFSADTPAECAVIDSTGTYVMAIGLTTSLKFTNVLNPPKTACMSVNACETIVSKGFTVTTTNLSTTCADPNDQTVYHLSDAQVQAAMP